MRSSQDASPSSRSGLSDRGGGIGSWMCFDEHGHRRLAIVERQPADEQLVPDHTGGVEIRPGADVLGQRLLRRHVGRRPHRAARGREVRGRRLVERLRDAEVGDLDRAVRGDHDVLRLQVAVHDAARLGVRQPREDALEHPGDLRQRQVRDERPQRPALDVLHRDVRGALVLEEVVDGDDVRMAERAGDTRLADETLGESGVGGVKRRQLLQGDDAVEVGLPGEIDDCHPAAADLTDDVVSPERTQDFGHRAFPRGFSDVVIKRTIGIGGCR